MPTRAEHPNGSLGVFAGRADLLVRTIVCSYIMIFVQQQLPIKEFGERMARFISTLNHFNNVLPKMATAIRGVEYLC